jgi:FimV-like protein
MGDNEMARSLLGEVLEQGSEDQKRDAQALIVRLG